MNVYLKVYLLFGAIIGIVGNILLIDEERKPITRGGAVIAVFLNAGLIMAVLSQ